MFFFKKKTLNDISDFSDENDFELKQAAEENTGQPEIYKKPEIIAPVDDEADSTDDQGDWVKVASNGHHYQEKKKTDKSFNEKSLATKAGLKKAAPHLTSTSPVKISNSLNSLDSFKDPSPSCQKADEASSSKKKSKLSKEDLLIPNSIDEEEVMLRKALELSLKEIASKPTDAKPKVSKLDAIDDFADDAFVTVNEPALKVKQLPAKTVFKPAPVVKPITVAKPQHKLPQVPKSAQKQHINPPALKIQQPIRPTSFAAVAAASLKPKTAPMPTYSAPISKPLNSAPKRPTTEGNASIQPLKWTNLTVDNKLSTNKPSDLMSDHLNEQNEGEKISINNLTLGSYIPYQKIKANESSATYLKTPLRPVEPDDLSKDFFKPNTDLPVDTLTASSFNYSVSLSSPMNSFAASSSNGNLVPFDLFNKNQDLSLSQPLLGNMKPYELENDKLESTIDFGHGKDYFGLSNEINVGCVLPKLSVSSTAASLLLPESQIDLVSPIKKPIGAERSINTKNAVSPNGLYPPAVTEASKVLTPPPASTVSIIILILWLNFVTNDFQE